MKKKIICIVAICIVFVMSLSYIGFVLNESNHLKGAKFNTKPTITLFEMEENGVTTYVGPGYWITYSKTINEYEENGITYIMEAGQGAEFKWFGITLWDWRLN